MGGTLRFAPPTNPIQFQTAEGVRPHSRGTTCPGDASSLSLEKKRAQGMPDAQSHPWHACNRKRHRYAETPAFPAQWFTAYTCSPRSTGLDSLRRCRGKNDPRKLDPSV